MKSLFAAACAAVAVAIAGQASAAATLNFDDLAHSGSYLSDGTTIVYGDYQIHGSLASGIGTWGLGDSRNPDPDGAAISSNLGGLFISRTDGQLFDVLSFDFAEFLNDGAGDQILILGWDPKGQNDFASATFDEAPGLQSKSLTGFTRISMIGIFPTLSWQGVQIDNVSIGDITPYPASVPEPGVWAMMIIGFGLIGTQARRHNRRFEADGHDRDERLGRFSICTNF